MVDKNSVVVTALKRELEKNQVSAESVPPEVLTRVADWCVDCAGTATEVQKRTGRGSLLAGSANLQSQIVYAARLIGATASGEIEIETLRSRSKGLYEALAQGLADAQARRAGR